jgi:hypothetical protein
MKGIGLISVFCGLTVVLALALLLGLSGDAESDTTYIDGNWYIGESTTLSSGTWVVNGSVYVVNGTLLLDNAVLEINASSSFTYIEVGADGRLDVRSSTLRGVSYKITMRLYNDTTFDNSSIDNSRGGSGNFDITHSNGELVFDHCNVKGGGYPVYSFSNLTARDTNFDDYRYYGLYWNSQYSGIPIRAVVVDCTFRGDGSTMGGVLMAGPGQNDIDSRATIRRCTLRDLQTGVSVQSFINFGSLLIEDNQAENMTRYGVYLDDIGSAITIRRNTWDMAENSIYGFYIRMASEGCVINNETVIGGQCGFMGQGFNLRVEIWDMTMTGSEIAIYAYYVYLDVHRSTIRSTQLDFYLYGSTDMRIFDCDHKYTASVETFGGRILETFEVNFTAVTWQEDTSIEEGNIIFENETGYQLGYRDNEDPYPVVLPTWLVTRSDAVNSTHARGSYEKDLMYFYSDLFVINESAVRQLIIIDDFTPELTIKSPKEDDKFPKDKVLIEGNFTERGIGLATIKVSFDNESWNEATTFPDDTWQVRLQELPDGVLTFMVNISDIAGNYRMVALPNVTIDTTWPHIDVYSPDKYVRSTPVRILVRTELGAEAYVQAAPVTVIEGEFSALLTFTREDTYNIHIRVIDQVGHENETYYQIVYDITPPPLQVDTPVDGIWLTDESILVTGTSEADATVHANGYTGEMEDGRFSILIPVEEGELLITITAEDKSGNKVQVLHTIYIDRSAPVVTLLAPGNDCSTARDRMVFAGRVTDNGNVIVTVDGLLADLVGLNWSRELPLVEGLNEIEVLAVDAAGNSDSKIVMVTVDTTIPWFEVSAKIGDDTYREGSGTIFTLATSVTFGIDVDEECTVEITGADDFVAQVGHSTKILVLDPGRNDFTINVVDSVGNRPVPVTFVVIYDAIAPMLTIVSPEDPLITEADEVKVMGTTEPDAEVTVNGIPALVLGNGTFAVVVPLEEGTNSIRVVAIDRAGNDVSRTLQAVRKEPEEEGLTVGGAAVIGGAMGLIVGLVVALVVGWLIGRRRGGVPAPEEPEEEEMPSEPEEEAPPPAKPELEEVEPPAAPAPPPLRPIQPATPPPEEPPEKEEEPWEWEAI